MCIAIFKPKDKTLSKETLKLCSENNPDGCGFAYVDNDKIVIKKFMDFDKFYEEYSMVENKSNMLIHFRIATHGEVELNNCHPFKLNDRMALIHNGVISGYGDKKTKTDTQDFINKVIGNISHKMWKNPSFIELVGKAIGYSKLVILDVSGKYYIVNEDKGEWDEGIWYSNTSYKKSKVVYNFPKKQTTTTQRKLYDPYKDDYDEWWSSYYSKLDKSIYKCKKCGKVFKEYSDIANPQCDVCKGLDVEEIGIEVDKKEYYYNDIK